MSTDRMARRPQLPATTAELCGQLQHRIPKIAIGNPGEQRETAWDIIPNWRTFLTTSLPELSSFSLPDSLTELLARCNERTVCEGRPSKPKNGNGLVSGMLIV